MADLDDITKRQRLIKQYEGFITSNHLDLASTWLDKDVFEMDKEDTDTSNLSDSSLNMSEKLVLGKRVERFFEFYIKNSSRYTLMAQNIQIQRNRTTIGELDFILEDLNESSVLHVELVCKFYVYDPFVRGTAIEKWIGPNRKDSLIEKLERLSTKQFPLLFEPETESFLDNLKIVKEKVQQKLCFKALLFVPINMYKNNTDVLKSNNVQGYWLKLSDFVKDEYGEHLFFLPEKYDWLVHPRQEEQWYSYASAKKLILEEHERKRSPLCWMKTTNGSTIRFFVVWW